MRKTRKYLSVPVGRLKQINPHFNGSQPKISQEAAILFKSFPYFWNYQKLKGNQSTKVYSWLCKSKAGRCFQPSSRNCCPGHLMQKEQDLWKNVTDILHLMSGVGWVGVAVQLGNDLPSVIAGPDGLRPRYDPNTVALVNIHSASVFSFSG